jgi:SSS family solute:Na+ symporter
VAVVFLAVPGGAGEVVQQAWAGGKMGLRDNPSQSLGEYFHFGLVAVTFWVLALNGLAENIQQMCTDQTKVQRYLAAKSLRGARLAVWITGLGCIPVWALFMFVGTCLFVFYGVTPAELPPEIAADNTRVFPHFILTEIPPGLAGLIIAALVAAAMSSIDSSMNGTATVLTEDIYKRHLAKDRSDRHYLIAARLITTLGGVLMIAAALLFAYLTESEALRERNLRRTVLDVYFVVGAIFAGALGGFFLLGFLTRRANSAGAAIGVAAGLLVVAWLTAGKFKLALLPEAWRSPTHPFLIGVFGNLTVFVVGYAASLLFARPPAKKTEQLTWHS